MKAELPCMGLLLCLVAKSCLTLLRPPGLFTARLLCPWDSLGKNIPSPGDLPDPGIKLMSPALAGKFFTTEPPGKPHAWG